MTNKPPILPKYIYMVKGNVKRTLSVRCTGNSYRFQDFEWIGYLGSVSWRCYYKNVDTAMKRLYKEAKLLMNQGFEKLDLSLREVAD